MEREIKSNLLSREEIDSLKSKFPDLQEDDKSVFLEFVDSDGVKKTQHWAKLRGAFGSDLDIEESIAKFLKEKAV